MIKAAEIKGKAESRYKLYLRSVAAGMPFERIVIPCDKRPSDDLVKYEAELKDIMSLSKEKRGYGYTITWQTVKKKNLGPQDIPVEISFETETDYLKFLRKESEVRKFKDDIDLIIATFPQFTEWVEKRPLQVVANAHQWQDIIKVLSYFRANPHPGLYIRELPIDVHTKFIEQNKGIIAELLDIIIGGHINADETSFERRFNLKYKEPVVRIRILYKATSCNLFNGIDDISIPISQLRKLDFGVNKIFVVENEINFLTFPIIPSSIVIWGHGYGVSALKDMPFIEEARIYYWGDIDAHGFEILSQFRGYYPNTESLLMDKVTFDKFYTEGVGKPSNVSVSLNLTEDEDGLYQHVKINNLRLEQEKIPQKYLLKTLSGLKII